jgi:hypothetical protein
MTNYYGVKIISFVGALSEPIEIVMICRALLKQRFKWLNIKTLFISTLLNQPLAEKNVL